MGHLTGLLVLQQKRLARKSYIVPDMLDIAHELRHRRTSDPRDKFFAVIGLTEDLQPGLIIASRLRRLMNDLVRLLKWYHGSYIH
jgi:hypothetical protein